MSFDPVSAAFDLGKSIIERVWAKPEDKAREMYKLTELAQKGDLAELNAHVTLLAAQIEVNKVQASHPSVFVSGARPAAIWAGVLALVWSGIIHPLLVWVWAFGQGAGWLPAELMAPPLIETSALITIVGSLLGVSGMRSFEKNKGVHKDSL